MKTYVLLLRPLRLLGTPDFKTAQDLQYLHDECPTDLWKTGLRNLARHHNLTWKDEHEAL